MRVVIAGGCGQLGRELRSTAPPGWIVAPFGSIELDVTRPDQVASVLARERPALVINAAAYNLVDAAEDEPDRAAAVNATGPEHLAAAAADMDARLIHISTDFVFDGAQSLPYRPESPAAPLSVYGATKLRGERAVARATGGTALTIRTAWLYAAHGRNFVRTMLGLMRDRREIGVVCDQIGTPTWARSLAHAIWVAAGNPSLRGTHHWTDAGVASRYDFAVAIQEEALSLRLLARAVPVLPLCTSDYPTRAVRPSYSVLDKTASWAVLGGPSEHWRVNLRRMLRELSDG